MPINILLRRCQGLSLIEVVVLVSMIGILSAFAVPHFTRISNGARASAVIALGANLRRATTAAHGQFIESGGRLATAKLAGKAISLKHGYPDADSSGIRSALYDVDGFTATPGEDFITFTQSDAPFASQCSVTYRAASSAGSIATTRLDTRGC